MKVVIVKDAALQKAAMESMDAFVKVFVTAIYDAIGGQLTAETMGELNSDQVTLLAWDILHEEVKTTRIRIRKRKPSCKTILWPSRRKF